MKYYAILLGFSALVLVGCAARRATTPAAGESAPHEKAVLAPVSATGEAERPAGAAADAEVGSAPREAEEPAETLVVVGNRVKARIGRPAEPVEADPAAGEERDFAGPASSGAPPPAPGTKRAAEAKGAAPLRREAEGRTGTGGTASAGSGGPEYRFARVAAPAIRAGRHDDNKEYNRFLRFLEENRRLVVYPLDVSERLVLRTVDEKGNSLPNCAVQVKSLEGKTLSSTVTYADGRTQFFPSVAASPSDRDFTVQARCGGETRHGQLARNGRREVELRFGFAREVPKPVPVDIAVVLDTTGSMQSQIDRLTKTLKAIHFQLTRLSTRPDIRFALVAYRDRGDDYVTRVTQFTGNVAAFQRVLDNLEADGGGDMPEDMQQALDKAMHELRWRPEALRLGFIVADAPPHTDYGQSYDYSAAMREALGRGIKWITVGAGGLGRDGEVVFRQIAQFSMGEYVFVTESGAGDHEGGAGEASHHVGSNYSTENLDQAIVRIVRRELSYLTDSPKDFDDTIVASADDGVPRDQVLKPAVTEVLRQLADYSSIKLASSTPVAVVPVTVTDPRFGDLGEYLTDQMILTASRNSSFRVLERDLKALAQEIKLQLSDLFDVTETVPIGQMIGADLLIVSKLTVGKEGASLFAKLVRVETGEVLSVARVELGANVLPSS